ncbi:DEAD/DEAH box helicase [Bacillus sp. CGMCC 1.16541]|uniref:DEAD/DEAH box helicase n=1 Tax=Bacillus sp. CGMCC 1.16541 TaxID=2185143 RepID=UPI000D734781|nr:DEAD/DEAH box helicase [Bacillus sp. CGMCC 1.16541]
MKFFVSNDLLVLNRDKGYPFSHCDTWKTPPLNPTFSYSLDLQQLLSGKQLLFDEISFPVDMIHEHYKQGYITYRKGIVQHPFLTCQRCGNEDVQRFSSFDCARCGQHCQYCRACIMMGRVSECTPLISWCGPFVPHNEDVHELHWKGELSPAQQVASDAVVVAIEKAESLLVWAVCGAGKTELLFQGIESALQKGKRVCIATPRTDVVLELAPRIQQAFPHANAIALYGGSPNRHVYAPLVIATTHQLFRFYEAFDVVIVDEVDAFPYSMDHTLQYAVQHAQKTKATVIYLTATPNEAWQKEVNENKRKAVTIPARYHRHPIPVPEFVWCGNWRKKVKKECLPTALERWLQTRIHENKACFVFVPRIDVLDAVVQLIKVMGVTSEGVHAEDPNRKENVQKFRNRQVDVLVTTTILERGVTVPNVDVAVLGAEDEIFTESALVQIAGRVGRSADYPTGDVTFFHYGKTNEMVKAKNHILNMNELARKRGLIHD